VATAGAEGVVRLWDVDGLAARGDPLGPLAAALTDVTISADGRTVVAAAANGEVARWSTAGRAAGSPFAAEDNTVWAVALSPDGATLALATDDEVVSLWRLDGDRPPVRLREVGSHGGGALDVGFVDGWTIAVTSRSGDVRLWDVSSGQALGPPLLGAGSAAWHLATTGDGTVWTATQAGAVVRIDALSGGVACAVAAESFDGRQRGRLLGGQDLTAC
jgi:WD40 repeat protein